MKRVLFEVADHIIAKKETESEHAASCVVVEGATDAAAAVAGAAAIKIRPVFLDSGFCSK